VAASATIIAFLRETSPFYVYSNPITPGEAAAASRALEILDSDEGRDRITHLHSMTARFRKGLERLGHETLRGPHPVVPLMIREPARTRALVQHLRSFGVLATGLHYPVVPQGEDEIRFQISSDHTPHDIDEALTALSSFSPPD
jgi:glycine C-acetyltransferase